MPSKKITPRDVFCRRLKDARQGAGFSQKQLGIAAGIDDFAASTRINRYEKGVHEVDIQTASRLAAVLNVPLAYLYAEDDQLASAILEFDGLPQKGKDQVMRTIKKISKKN